MWGDRIRATSAAREQRDSTAAHTRSRTAAIGSAASGSASAAWYSMPAPSNTVVAR